ncbi:vacuolar carboxypeptidase [Grosmannia clavigera kw1407]|uniref:Vacuolar carboxypeptidase n=1 Tax=Grosmannia clavigera (strain kw1407 / UAMH 11150) TaxID=655863 RepID=F0XKT6_GROCL|nr:vacuolar carboxypeptidase [Grosmannia clavigera kw1407]EFX01806.1 vacuolar carboxypeptidase [Grosmannia clavigera kw1407]
MRLHTFAVLSLAAGHGLSAAVGPTEDEASQRVLSSSSSFECDVPPAVSPDSDGLPSADELFSGPEALQKQVERHGALVRIPSISYDDMADVNEDPRWDVFLDVHRLLEELYPAVHARMNRTKVNRLGLVYTIAGSDPSLRPVMLTAHQDVVPVADGSTWTHAPFSGHFDGTMLWGRGAYDDKNSLTALMSALEALFLTKTGWTPRRGLVLALGFDEETSGQRGAGTMAPYLERRFGRDSMALLLDEGSAGLERLGDVVFALPSVLEKGHVDVLYELRVAGGHSSMPFPHTGIGIAAEMVAALEQNPYAPAILPGSPLHQSYCCKARYAPEANPEITRLIRQDRLDELATLLAAIDRPTNFRLQTSQSVDLIAGGVKINAMPEVVRLGVNYRVATHESIDAVKRKTVQLMRPIAEKYGLTLEAFKDSGFGEAEDTVDSNVVVLLDAVKPLYQVDYNGTLRLTTDQETQPAPVSPTTGPVWDLFSGTIQHTFAFEGGKVVPAGDLMNGNTDTRHYLNLTRNIYRWLPMMENAGMNPHTVDEGIDMHAHMGVIRFYYNLIRNFDASDPPGVNARVVGEFGVEARAKDIVLLDSHDVAIDAAKHTNRMVAMTGIEQLGHDGGADEDGVEEILQKGQFDVSLEAVDLAAKMVAVDTDVEAANMLLAAFFGCVDPFGQEDETSTGAPGGFFGADKLAQPIHQARARGHERERGALAAWNDEAVTTSQFVNRANLHKVKRAQGQAR